MVHRIYSRFFKAIFTFRLYTTFNLLFKRFIFYNLLLYFFCNQKIVFYTQSVILFPWISLNPIPYNGKGKLIVQNQKIGLVPKCGLLIENFGIILLACFLKISGEKLPCNMRWLQVVRKSVWNLDRNIHLVRNFRWIRRFFELLMRFLIKRMFWSNPTSPKLPSFYNMRILSKLVG